MEAIRNYLDTMFSSLPNTPEVAKAKEELWQMMEDKYTELKNEGKTENEAVGTVIAEFGNLEELAEDLGISGFVKEGNESELSGRIIELSEVKDFLADKKRWAYMIALGVLLCIISPTGVIITDELLDNDTLGLLFMFLSIGIAVAIFIFSGITSSKWDYFTKEACHMDFATTKYVKARHESFRTQYALMLSTGVLLFIISVLPPALSDELSMAGFYTDALAPAIMFFIIAVGVFMIVSASIIQKSFETLIITSKRANGDNSYGTPAHKQNGYRYNNPKVAAVMSVYWYTVTCIYLCISFLTFDWHITWIIWVLAAIIESLIKHMDLQM